MEIKLYAFTKSFSISVFAEICVMYASSLPVKAIYTNDKITISATLQFNYNGELIDFISEDCYYCEDGINYSIAIVYHII